MNTLIQKILLIGAGNMGGAIGKALLESNYLSPENLLVSDTSSEKLQFFADKNCTTALESTGLLPHANIVILAIKPQVLREALETWKPLFAPNTIVVSIAAGVSVEDIQKFSGQKKIVRVMPNTPLLVGRGVSGYYFSDAIQKEERGNITNLMNCFGVAIECQSEEKINAITALSGSGPAYFFRILEIMSEQAESFGFSEEESQKIVLETMQGAGLLAEKSPENFSMLRENVTSKGGTTQAALQFFEKNTLETVLKGGIKAAKKRAEVL
jgi:pyrroline-5-carboxylate reductase